MGPHDAAQDDAPPPFERRGPGHAATPLVYAVPHAGRHYPPSLLAASAVPRAVLEELEDRHADRLVERAVAHGAVAIVARVARAWIDLNRGEQDLDPALRDPAGSGPPASARAQTGLGRRPARGGRRSLWRVAPSPAEAARRVALVHQPYHAAIAHALAEACARFGHAVLIDCHSMPPLGGTRPAAVVIGDLHGRSAGAGVAAQLLKTVREAGYLAAHNAPYAGAYGIERHGQPVHGIHALQIEIDRSLYLTRDLRTISSGLAAASALLLALGRQAVVATQPRLDIAAE